MKSNRYTALFGKPQGLEDAPGEAEVKAILEVARGRLAHAQLAGCCS